MRREKIETSELFPPQKLESLFIDIKNKKFLLNGKDFGKRCKSVSIDCDPPKWQVKVIIERPIEFTSEYNLDGDKESEISIAELIPIKDLK